MNILVATLGSYGDVFPMVAIAASLSQRGHSVTLFTNAYFRSLAARYGLDFVPLGTEEEYHRFADHPGLFDPRQGFSVFMSTLVLPNIRRAYEQLQARIQPGKTVIVTSLTVFAARLIQEKLSIPTVTIHPMPMAIKSAYEIPKAAGISLPAWSPRWLRRLYWWVADKAVIDPMICPELNALRQELGLPPVDRVLSRWVHSPQRVICLFPEWYASPQPDWPPETHLAGFILFAEGDEDELGEEVLEFLNSGEAPVVFMPGSLMQQAQAIFEESVKACEMLGKRAILLSRYAQQIPKHLPPGIRHFGYIPFSRLLPHAAALVHHGGIGTGAQAMRAAVPQLIHPMAYDQYDNAARLRALGVGDWIGPGDYRAPRVADKLRELTESPSVRERRQAVAARFENIDPLGDTCKLIETML